ncbi:nickel pincer cofactor biosynthesis protein LarC [Streptosporangiaceae bacterium NEAU-GS5]|nr:nickel pincer cofactor biosynthesis protein LarC [Streptosporangiaceae bacterium NEAU-GS5]
MICWINPFTGLAGDMLLGALIDAGAPLDDIRSAVGATGLTGWELTAERVTDHGLTSTRVTVHVADRQAERAAADLITMAARTTEPVAALAGAALTAIAEAEAHLHSADPASVHLHELGGHDTLVDIVGTAAALHALGVTDVVCAPLPLGTGQIGSAHGIIPCPAPATLALLRGATVVGTTLRGETVTPTAAALLTAACARYGPPPPMTLGPTGYGAGSRRLPDRPNVVAVTLGSAVASEPGGETVVVLSTNLDDVTGETLAYTVSRVLEAGALDAWATPAVMKKGRPAHVLHVLARPETAADLRRLVLAETGSLGIRQALTFRTALPRRFDTVEVDGVPIRIKHGPYGAKPEHDDLAKAAALLGLPLRTVAERAMRERERLS